MNIRSAGYDDTPALVALARTCNPSPWSFEAIHARVMDPSGFVRVIETLAGEIVAWMMGTVVGDEAEIYDIGVLPRFRRQGYGGLLVREALQTARVAGAVALFLEVRASNRAARTMYVGLGFVEVGHRRRYYRQPEEDAIVLRCSVTDGG